MAVPSRVLFPRGTQICSDQPRQGRQRVARPVRAGFAPPNNSSQPPHRGGGDTVSALAHAGVKDDFTYVSTAGGAFLEWMEGKTLPGVAALMK